MPTKKKRQIVTDSNASPALDPKEKVPALYTGEKLLNKDPERYARVVTELASGKPVTRIARSNKISPETVAAIMHREKETVQAVEGMTKSLTQYASQTALVRLVEKLERDELPATLLPICYGVLRDHQRKDAGMADHVIEVKRSLTLQDVKRELESFKKDAIDVEDAEIKEK
jgi:hypothetical protein